MEKQGSQNFIELGDTKFEREFPTKRNDWMTYGSLLPNCSQNYSFLAVRWSYVIISFTREPLEFPFDLDEWCNNGTRLASVLEKNAFKVFRA